MENELCESNFSYQVTMKDGKDLIPSIRYDKEKRQISFVPHATEEVGTHEVTVVANLTSEAEENNGYLIEDAITVTVTSSIYPQVATTIDLVEATALYDSTFTLPQLTNEGEFAYSLKLKDGPDFVAFDSATKQLVFSDVSLADIGEYLITFDFNSETTVVTDADGQSVTRSAEDFNDLYLVDLEVKNITGKLRIQSVAVEADSVINMKFADASYIRTKKEEDVLDSFAFEIVEGAEGVDYSALEVSFLSFSEDGTELRVKAEVPGLALENEEKLMLNSTASFDMLSISDDPGKRLAEQSFLVTLGVEGTVDKPLTAEEDEPEDPDEDGGEAELSAYQTAMLEQCEWL